MTREVISAAQAWFSLNLVAVVVWMATIEIRRLRREVGRR